MFTNLYMAFCKAVLGGKTITGIIRRETRKEPLVVILGVLALGVFIGCYFDGNILGIAIGIFGLALGLLLGHLYW